MVVAVVFAIACLKLNPRFVIRFSFIVTLFFIVPVSYTQDFQGSLAGVVMDSSGGRIPAADIVLQANESSLERQTKSDNRGEFRFDDLLPGVYKVTVRAPGFADASSTVTVIVSFAREITVTLNLPPRSRRVNVQARHHPSSPNPWTPPAPCMAAWSRRSDLETIPLAMRSFANIAYLVPGTEPVEPSDPTKARITAVSFGGSSGLERRALGGWRRQFRRLHRRVSAEFLAGRHSGIRRADLAAGCRHRPHRGRFGGDHHQARHQSSGMATPLSTNAPRRSMRVTRSKIPRLCPSSRSRGRTISARSADPS